MKSTSTSGDFNIFMLKRFFLSSPQYFVISIWFSNHMQPFTRFIKSRLSCLSGYGLSEVALKTGNAHNFRSPLVNEMSHSLWSPDFLQRLRHSESSRLRQKPSAGLWRVREGIWHKAVYHWERPGLKSGSGQDQHERLPLKVLRVVSWYTFTSYR